MIVFKDAHKLQPMIAGVLNLMLLLQMVEHNVEPNSKLFLEA